MSLTIKQGENRNYPPVEAGTHHAICTQVIELGTQKEEWDDDVKWTPKVLLGFEFADLTIEVETDEGTEQKPRVLSKKYTKSMHEKSNLYKDLIAWRGVEFTEEEKMGFSLTDVLGVNCLLQVIHKPKKKGGIKAIIGNVSKLMKNMQKARQKSDLVSYDIDEDGVNIPEGLPDWVIKTIKESVEYQELVGEPQTPPVPDDDIPF